MEAVTEPLTRRQLQVLTFIRFEIGVEKRTPTAKSIAKHIRIKNVACARDHLRTLERKGYIRLKPGFQIELTHADKRDSVVEAARAVLKEFDFCLGGPTSPAYSVVRNELRRALAALDGAP